MYRVSPDGPAKLTAKPVSALTFTDAGVELGVERCYDVRTVTTQGSASFESAPSPPACLTPADTFPPPAPTSLAAVAGEGAISLIWKGVEAPDLAGYVVLRGDAPSGELTPLFETPIRESTYRDTGGQARCALRLRGRGRRPGRSAEQERGLEQGGRDGEVGDREGE